MTRNIQQPKRLRAKQIVQLYGVGLSTVWNYAKEGKITPIKVTNRVTVFDVEEVEKLFSGNCKTA